MTAKLRGRPRSLDRSKKRQICDLVSRGATLAQAAAALSISARTIHREARLDENFDEQLRQAFSNTPDPLTIMQSAARTHWRAAAWLLERTDPEHFAKRPAHSASPFMFQRGLEVVVEAALEATPPEFRADMYQRLVAACQNAFKCVFPDIGPWHNRNRLDQLQTPLLGAEWRRGAPQVFDAKLTLHLDANADEPADDLESAKAEAGSPPEAPIAEGDAFKARRLSSCSPEEFKARQASLRTAIQSRDAEFQSPPPDCDRQQSHSDAVETANALARILRKFLSRKKHLATKTAADKNAGRGSEMNARALKRFLSAKMHVATKLEPDKIAERDLASSPPARELKDAPHTTLPHSNRHREPDASAPGAGSHRKDKQTPERPSHN
jgi:hypothetical protein